MGKISSEEKFVVQMVLLGEEVHQIPLTGNIKQTRLLLRAPFAKFRCMFLKEFELKSERDDAGDV